MKSKLFWSCLTCGSFDPVQPTGCPERYKLGDHEPCTTCGDGTARVVRQAASATPLAFAESLVALARFSGQMGCQLIESDNVSAMEQLVSEGALFTLAYLDPPFLTGRQHDRVVREVGPSGVTRSKGRGFDDRWSGLEEYLSELRRRVVLVRELLEQHGCMVLHLDTKTSHYAKVMCDEVFGRECFASEIVWRYRRWPSKTPNFQRVHDVLLRYVRDASVKPRFRQLYEPLAASTRATWGDKKQRAVVRDGRRARSETTETESPGVPMGDVWEIGIIAPVAKERTGYPTQKPEALLSRLVEALTDPGDAVLDPYCGSGTTLAVCARLGRRSVGIDENPEALALARSRLEGQ